MTKTQAAVLEYVKQNGSIELIVRIDALNHGQCPSVPEADYETFVYLVRGGYLKRVSIGYTPDTNPCQESTWFAATQGGAA